MTMSNPFYARYVPPKKSQSSDAAGLISEKSIDAAAAENDEAEVQLKKSKKKKKDKRIKERKRKSVDVEPQPDTEENHTEKHRAVFVKFQHSSKLSSKLKAKLESQPEDNGHNVPSPELHDLTPLPQPVPSSESNYQPNFSSLPSWISNPKVVGKEAQQPFQHLGIKDKLLENLQTKQLISALPIQSALLPLLLPGLQQYNGDICVSAPTGSGKTLAYLLPLVQMLKTKLFTSLRALIVVPTRELVSQARQEAEFIAAGTGVRIGVAVGSKSLSQEQSLLVDRHQKYDPEEYKRLEEVCQNRFNTGFHENDGLLDDLGTLLPSHVYEYSSQVDILICTPGRLVEHINSTRGFSLQNLKYLVIDEADRLLDESFQEWVTVLLNAIQGSKGKGARDIFLNKASPLGENNSVKKIILSATMTRDLAKLALLQLHQPMLVGIEPEYIGQPDAMELDDTHFYELPSTLQEMAIPVGDGSDKPLYLLQLLNNLLGEESGVLIKSDRTSKILVFTNGTEDAIRLMHILSIMQPNFANQLDTLTKLSSKSGQKTLSAFKTGRTRILIATDRASRGLDVPDLTAVISYDMPKDLTLYVHRVGRTARAGKTGVSWSFFTNSEGRWFWNSIAKAIQIRRSKPVERRKLELSDILSKSRYEEALEHLKTAVHGK